MRQGDKQTDTYFHLSDMLHDILEILICSETGEIVGYHFLSVASQHLGCVLNVHASRLFGFDKEVAVARGCVRHRDNVVVNRRIDLVGGRLEIERY